MHVTFVTPVWYTLPGMAEMPTLPMPQAGFRPMSAQLAGRLTITKAWERLGQAAQHVSGDQFAHQVSKMPAAPMPSQQTGEALHIVRGGGICGSGEATALDQSTMKPLACQVTPGPDPRRRWQDV